MKCSGFVWVSIAYIILIGIVMLYISPWWFLALFLWDWNALKEGEA